MTARRGSIRSDLARVDATRDHDIDYTEIPEVTPEQKAALHAKYLAERDRRINKNHNDQYIPTSGKWAEIYEIDPYTPVTPRDPVTGETEVVILGAGFCGMMVAHQLKQAGITDF